MSLQNLNWLFVSSFKNEPEVEYQPHPAEVYNRPVVQPAPDSFQLSPVKEWKDIDPPEPTPAGRPLRPFKSPRVFHDVDNHAVQVSKVDHTSFKELMWHLIFAKGITHELEKVRAVFVWLSCKNVETIKFDGKVIEGTPEETLKDLNGGKTTMATAFDIMCRNAGIQSKRIIGHAKTGPCRPGQSCKHVWNSVRVDDQWGLMEVMWAATKLKKQAVTAELLQRDLDEFFFFSPPQEFVLTHLPDDAAWQLLDNPLTLTDFESLVHVKSAFCRLGLRVLSHSEAAIKCGSHLTVAIGSPANRMISFIFKLTTDGGREDFNGTPLNRYVMQQTIDDVTTYTFRLPAKGSYVFTIYAKDCDSARKEESFGGVCIYMIDSDADPSDYAIAVPFPPCTYSRYGPTDKAAGYGITPSINGYIIKTKNGKAELQFKLPPKELGFMAKLKSNTKDDKELSRYTMYRTVDGVAIFNILAPATGEFGLEIYCRDIKVDGTSLFHVYQYLVICEELSDGKPVDPLPVLSPGYLGPQPSYSSLGLKTISHSDPYIESGSGNLDVVFSTSQPLRMSSQLIYAANDQAEDSSDYVLQQSQGDRVVFKTRFCKPGVYKLQIFALPIEDTSESLPGVYNYLINCLKASSNTNPYPKQYSPWKAGCFLHEPLDGKLVPDQNGKSLIFRVDVPKTSSMAVVIGKDWNQLALRPSGSWEGEVKMDDHWGGSEKKVKLCAKMDDGDNYSILLEYSI